MICAEDGLDIERKREMKDGGVYFTFSMTKPIAIKLEAGNNAQASHVLD